MKPEDQRIAIAEAVGWEKHREIEPGHWVWRHPVTKLVCGQPLIPDYPNDLNAMHEAEETLNELELNHMVQFLYGIPGRFWRATAAQRAEAFLKVIGKWVD